MTASLVSSPSRSGTTLWSARSRTAAILAAGRAATCQVVLAVPWGSPCNFIQHSCSCGCNLPGNTGYYWDRKLPFYLHSCSFGCYLPGKTRCYFVLLRTTSLQVIQVVSSNCNLVSKNRLFNWTATCQVIQAVSKDLRIRAPRKLGFDVAAASTGQNGGIEMVV